MASLSHLSRIGFGCYRVSVNSQEHYNALLYALSMGCNLIDTSANYMNGDSERLVGKVLQENPQYDPFVITKAGYIQGDNLNVMAGLAANGLGREGLITFSSDFQYSIHPDFLNAQIQLSCNRLQRGQIDGFLLHNPEHYFEQNEADVSQEEYYNQIERAFEFLEEKVSEGVIRYYGISSNTFPLSTDLDSTTNLNKVLRIARGVSENNHFKLIEFPFNLVETEALEKHHDNAGLIEVAKANDITTFTNRPLNAGVANGILRLAGYEHEIEQLDEENDRHIYDNCVELVRKQLQELGSSDEPFEFEVIKYLNDNWMKLGNPEAVTQIFQGYFFPFLGQLYEGEIPQREREAYLNFYRYAILYSKKTMTEKALAFRSELVQEGMIKEDDTRPLPVIACQTYLNSGIDHVLVGMRNVRYVDSLKTLFYH